MHKKILLGSLLFCISPLGVASAPYIGASIGVLDNTLVAVNGSNFSNASYRGIPFNVFLGYGAVINENFYIGAEITGTLFTADLNDNGLKTSYGFGGSLMPGFMLCDHTLAFVRLGILSAHFSSLENSTRAWQGGLGLQTSFTQNIDVRGEYDYVSYNEIYGISPRSDQVYLSFIYKFD